MNAMQALPYLREIRVERETNPHTGDYPFSIPAIQALSSLAFHPSITFLIGENGSGKSTLIEAIALAMGFGAEGGTRNSRFATADTVSSLYKALKLVKSFKKPTDYYFLRAESFFNLASYMDQAEYLEGYGGKSLHQRSHGEAFMTVLTMKMRGRGLYLLDEPEAALSPNRQLAALSAIHRLVKQQSQFIIATHSPILMSYPDACIYRLDDQGIQRVTYEETEHYVVTRRFLANPARMLQELLKEE